MENLQYGHDISDVIWSKLEPSMTSWTWGGSDSNDSRNVEMLFCGF